MWAPSYEFSNFSNTMQMVIDSGLVAAEHCQFYRFLDIILHLKHLNRIADDKLLIFIESQFGFHSYFTMKLQSYKILKSHFNIIFQLRLLSKYSIALIRLNI